LQPKLSIITINRNNATGLRKTMESVFSQTGLEKGQLEYIIIDGASTDNSVEVINEFLALPENNEKVSYWISEPDKGIYNAMNKGINHANGEYCLFLNSGDRFLTSDILEYSLKILLNTNTIYYGNVQNSKNGKLTHIHFYPEQIDVNYFISKTINHQNTFIPVKYLRTYGWKGIIKVQY
jgi:glycosyltransferase involved in cell wall biosynthesis